MSVIPLTIFFSLLLAGLFIALFVHEQRRRRFASAESDSLLPLAEETPHEAGTGRDDHAHAAGSASHSLGDAGCGCRDGARPPCTGCRKRSAVSSETVR